MLTNEHPLEDILRSFNFYIHENEPGFVGIRRIDNTIISHEHETIWVPRYYFDFLGEKDLNILKHIINPFISYLSYMDWHLSSEKSLGQIQQRFLFKKYSDLLHYANILGDKMFFLGKDEPSENHKYSDIQIRCPGYGGFIDVLYSDNTPNMIRKLFSDEIDFSSGSIIIRNAFSCDYINFGINPLKNFLINPALFFYVSQHYNGIGEPNNEIVMTLIFLSSIIQKRLKLQEYESINVNVLKNEKVISSIFNDIDMNLSELLRNTDIPSKSILFSSGVFPIRKNELCSALNSFEKSSVSIEEICSTIFKHLIFSKIE